MSRDITILSMVLTFSFGLWLGLLMGSGKETAAKQMLHQVCHDYEVQKAVDDAMQMVEGWDKYYLKNEGCEEYRQTIREEYLEKPIN